MARILCIEDENEIRDDLVEELIDAGHEVFAASNGEDGLRAVEEFSPDLIISDCLMPKLTGLELFQELRRRMPEFADRPFVFLSAHADKSHVEEGMKLGANAYLTKPVDFDRLTTIVNSLLIQTTKGSTGNRGGSEDGELAEQ